MTGLDDALGELRALADGDVTKMPRGAAKPRRTAGGPKASGNRGAGARGRTGTTLPKSAPVHAAPKVGSPEWHAGKRAAMQRQGEASRAHLNTGHKMPAVRHGGFQCANCGHRDWREHKVVTAEGKHHATLAFKGCVKCGTMHPTRVGVSKTDGEPVDVAKDVDATETAVQRDDNGHGVTDLVGHRTNCPKGGDAPCGAERDGECGVCGAHVEDHQALTGKSIGAALIDLRKLAHDLT